jgi:hypothetical protein
MKKITFSLLLVSVALFANAQSGNNLLGYKNGIPVSTSRYMKCTGFRITRPVRDLAKQGGNNTNTEQKEPVELPVQVGKERNSMHHLNKEKEVDPVLQRAMGTMTLDTPLVNFEGVNWAYRPDATCAAGPNYIVQCVNLCQFAVYDKTGNPLLTTDMSTIGFSCSDDPIVMYDKFADRWFLSDVSNGYSDLTIAVSTTSDPTGTYYVYSFAYPVMPDFPKYSIWPDGYYATYRDISMDTVGVCVFDRNRMLKGDPSAGMIVSKFPNAHVINKNSQLPASPRLISCDGVLPPYGTPEYLMYYTNVNMGDPSNSIMIYQLNTDTTAKTCKLTFVDSLATAPYNGYFAGYQFGGNIIEPGGQSVWSLEGFFAIKAPYIRFTGYNSVVLSNTVNLGDSVGGIRWYELRQNDTTSKWSIYQQGTYGPNDSVSRWNSGIAMNMNGDISIAYDVTNKYNLYPGIRYTGRLASDPPGVMTFKEQTAIKGTHSFDTQWGDICGSWLDPDGYTFWHTNQYIIDSTSTCDGCGTANVRIFSYKLSTNTLAVGSLPAHAEAVKVFQSGEQLNVRVNGLSNNDKVVVNLFDINGKQLLAQWLTPRSNGFETTLNVSSFARGVYLVRVGNSGFQKVVKVIIE